MGFSFKKLIKAAKPLVTGPRIVDPFAKKGSVVSAFNRKLDKTVGGAQGWSVVTKAAAPVVAMVPVYGQIAAAGLTASSAVLAAEAKKQAAKKAERELAAANAAATAEGLDYTNGYISAPGSTTLPTTVGGAAQGSGYVAPTPIRDTFPAWLARNVRALFTGAR